MGEKKKTSDVYRKTYFFIKHFIEKNGYSPSLPEIAEKFGIYVGAAAFRVKKLKKMGYITNVENKSRTIQILLTSWK